MVEAVAAALNKQSASQALATLEAKAMHIAGEHAGTLGDSATIAVRGIYSKVGAVNPAYGTPTFAGIEKIFDLTVPILSAKTQSASLAQALAKGFTPRAVTITVTGKLPPM